VTGYFKSPLEAKELSAAMWSNAADQAKLGMAGSLCFQRRLVPKRCLKTRPQRGAA